MDESSGSGAQHRAVRPEELLVRLNGAERQNAPDWLYLAGDSSLLGFRPRVSIVGTRRLKLFSSPNPCSSANPIRANT